MNEPMKIYISLPISGLNLERCKSRAAKAAVTVRRKGHTPVTPFDVCPEPDLTYAEYIGRDITALLDCDAVYMLKGWYSSSGCRIEYHAAGVFHKRTYLCGAEIPDLNADDE